MAQSASRCALPWDHLRRSPDRAPLRSAQQKEQFSSHIWLRSSMQHPDPSYPTLTPRCSGPMGSENFSKRLRLKTFRIRARTPVQCAAFSPSSQMTAKDIGRAKGPGEPVPQQKESPT